MTDDKNFYITTPIYYVNDIPHLGHAYTSMACDAMARFKRLDGYNTMFLTGTDEHGQKVLQSAEKNNITPQEHADKYSSNFRELTDLLNLSNDDFVRTTEERHIKSAQEIWKRIVDKGDIYLDKYAGWYSVREEAFYAESELTDGPNGEKICPLGSVCEWQEEESYFFKLSEWEDRLLKYYDENPDCILPKSRRNEVISFVKGGLRDLSVSRTSFDWGVPVPGDDKHVMYVWIDALTNYITGLGFPDENAQKFKDFWPADIHMVGKDILRFHAVYWPAFLMSAGLQPPKRVYAHGWWTVEGEKMSKSLGNAIAPKGLVDKYGLDQTRYYVLRQVPFGNDGDFSHETMVGRMNSDLANNLGNLVQRSLSMIAKNCDGKVPVYGAFSDADIKIMESAYHLLTQIRDDMDVQAFNLAFDKIWYVIGEANAYIDEQAPWTLKKTDPTKMQTVLYTLAEVIRVVGLIIQPYMPESASKILDQVAIPEEQRNFSCIHADHALVSGTDLPKPQGVFPRYIEEEDADQKATA